MDKIRVPASFEQSKPLTFSTQDSRYTTDAIFNNSTNQKELVEMYIPQPMLTIPSPFSSALPSTMFSSSPTEQKSISNLSPLSSALPSSMFSSSPTQPNLLKRSYPNSFVPSVQPTKSMRNKQFLTNLHHTSLLDIPSSSENNPDPCPGQSLTTDKLDSYGQHLTDFIINGHNDECLIQNDAELKAIIHPNEYAAEEKLATSSPQECMTPLPASPRHGFAFQDLDCLENLPDVVENLSHAQKQQAAEIEKQYQILADKKATLKKVQDKLHEISDELSRCKRQTCLAEEETAERSQNCKMLQNDIENASLEDLQNSKRIQEVERKTEENERLFAEYNTKMKSHKHLVSELESGKTSHLEVKKQLEIIQKLQAEKAAMESELLNVSKRSVDPELELHQVLKSLKEENQLLVMSINKTKAAIRSEKAKHTSLKQDTEVLRKRNHAQLTRLKKQLKEVQLRNKQWHDEACQLEAHITRLRKFIEE